MVFDTPEHIVETLVRAMPFPDRMREMNFSKSEVRFTWLGHRVRVAINGSVEEVEGDLLSCSTMSYLVKALLERAAND